MDEMEPQGTQTPNTPGMPRDDRTPPSIDGINRTAPRQSTGLISDFQPRPAQAAATRPIPDVQPRPETTSAAPSAEAASASASDKPEDQPASHVSFAQPETPSVEPREKTEEKSAWHDVLSIVGVLVSALLLAFCLISFVFQSYQVDGPSMQTTLENNDHLIVWKVSKTIANLTGNHYIPNRGDVIIFNEPVSNGSAQNKQLVKRVLGMPGERVVVKDGVVTVYNQERPDGFQPDKELPYGNVITTTPGDVDVTLKEGQVFVCGDNRTNSLDSRIFGPVNSDQIIGKLILRVLPINTIKTF